jgi:hypothetical protein
MSTCEFHYSPDQLDHVKGESLQVWENAAKRLSARKLELSAKIAESRMKASSTQGEMWATCRTLISVLESCEDREAARFRLQSALRRVVKKLVCLFIKNGRRQLACVQFHFDGSDQIRTVFICHRGELTNVKEKTPEHVSWSTRLDGVPEAKWNAAFEPDRPTGEEKIRLRKQKYMKTYQRRRKAR